MQDPTETDQHKDRHPVVAAVYDAFAKLPVSENMPVADVYDLLLDIQNVASATAAEPELARI